MDQKRGYQPQLIGRYGGKQRKTRAGNKMGGCGQEKKLDLGGDHKEVPSEDKFGGYKTELGENIV